MATESGGIRSRQTHLHPPFAQPDPGRRAEGAAEVVASPAPVSFTDVAATVAEAVSAREDLPSIDDFIDDVPSIEEFVERRDLPAPATGGTEEGWAAGDWQSFDWNAAGALGAPAPEVAEAHAAWSTTDWDARRGRTSAASERFGGEANAVELAAALDTLAHRIRTGELSLDRFRGTPPEAALAAAFAALLRNRA